MIAANRANRPITGSPTIKPANDANATSENATVALIMFSILLPFCVWYVVYGSALQIFVIYKDFVIILSFVDSPGK
jgi:hypothetical protein